MFYRFLLRRFIYIIPLVIITTLIVFSFILLMPGDPALSILGQSATPEKIAQLNAQLGLDKPILVQYFDWLKNVLQGDLGKSIHSGRPVNEAVFGRLTITIQLVIVAMLIAIIGGSTFAIASIYYPNSWIDKISRLLGVLGGTFPNFWLAALFVLFFSINLGWVPATGFTSVTENPILFLKGIIFPALALGAAGISQVSRHLRSAFIEVMDMDYIRTAYSKGFPRKVVIFRHALQNALLPVVTTIGILFGNLLGATVVIETFFAIPGMGQLAVNSILQRDFTMLQGVVLVMILMIILINFIIDIIYSLIDPKIEY